MFRAMRDRERHYAFRFLQKSQSRAFQARLKAAITASGIESDLPFRRLVLFRVGPPPAGPASEKLIEELRARGGIFIEPSQTELATLWAIRALRQDSRHSHMVSPWLASKRPVSRLSSFIDAVEWLYGENEPSAAESKGRTPSYGTPLVTVKPPPSSRRKITRPGMGIAPPEEERMSIIPATPRPSKVPSSGPRISPSLMPPPKSQPQALRLDATLPIGDRLIGGAIERSLAIPLLNLRKHAVVLAGSGSGKTVLLKRLVEEAVLLGVPSIIIDGDNDLSMLGDVWASAPDAWRAGDAEKARRYHDQSDVVIWTPGINRGNPLCLHPIPDLGALADDADELEVALSMVVSNLAPIVAPAGGRAGQMALGVLTGALRHLARRRGGGLQDLVGLLRDLPSEAYESIERGDQIARRMSEQLLAETRMNPLFREVGTELDPHVLFGSRAPGRTRVSVINLSGLQGEAARQQFIGQLSMTLFSYVKKHPARGQPLLGLLVIDEASEYVPSTRSVPGKDNMLRLVAQARKYGLGMLFATQAPKSIDPQIIASCATQFYGRAASPAAIETVREQLKLRGGNGTDIAMLEPGVFYAHTEGMKAPVRVATRLCLSAHPANPLDDAEIVKRAGRSRLEALSA